MKKQTTLFFYFLSTYVILQFAWWGYHLIELSRLASSTGEGGTRRMFMILGEGMVFFLILILGIWKLRSSIKKELRISRNQNNFLLSVTHELKTPIASSKLYLQTLQKHSLDPEKHDEILRKALQENQRLEKMIDNILNASRLESRKLVLHTEKLDASAFVTSIVERYRKYAPEAQFETAIPEDIQTQADPFILETILNNLIENALKYAGTAGPICVEMVKDQHLHILVKDQGPGIPAQHQKDIFKKFYRLGNEDTRTQKGSGLGLFIAAEFSRLHKGQIKYHANQPKGAIFELILQ